jgi:SAM-dependent methyltransferase
MNADGPGSGTIRLDDPTIVHSEYATESGLRARWSVYADVGGPDPGELAFEAVAEARPRTFLEVGCGWGDFAARVQRDLDADVVAIDISPRMVELAREQGVDARVADVQQLPFGDGSFDCVAANWMLYHVPDVGRGLAEIARVLRPGGRLVAATNGLRHLGELWALVGRDRGREPVRFFAETGEELLRRHFDDVERRDTVRQVVFADADAVRARISSSVAHKHLATRVPELSGPFHATAVQVVFVCRTPLSPSTRGPSA